MLPGPIDASTGRQQEEHDRDCAPVAAAAAHGVVRQPVECAVALRQRKEQRDPGQGQEQLAREPAHHGVHRHPADVDTDDPCHGHGQHADVEGRDTADDDGHRERAHGQDREIHDGSGRSDTVKNSLLTTSQPRALYMQQAAEARSRAGTQNGRPVQQPADSQPGDQCMPEIIIVPFIFSTIGFIVWVAINGWQRRQQVKLLTDFNSRLLSETARGEGEAVR